MSKFFGLVNGVESHNKPRQSDIALEKFRVKQCGWLQLFNTVAMGTTITNFCKLFFYGVKIDHYDNFIGIRGFLERLAMDCFSNPFTTYTGAPEKNIHSFDEIDNEGNVSTCQVLNYYSYSP